MESSRIFVKGLPPSISETEIRRHFETKGWEITDIKLIPRRRIGFVGYKTSEDAAKAVKHFNNRSYIRQCKIAVELARPISAPSPSAGTGGNADGTDTRRASAETARSEAKPAPESKKRKRDGADESDPKLQEFLEVMYPGHAVKKQRDGSHAIGQQDENPAAHQLQETESDDEYESIPRRPLHHQPIERGSGDTPEQDQTLRGGVVVNQTAAVAGNAEGGILAAGVSDDEWLRSRTNRLLDLVDADDPSLALKNRPQTLSDGNAVETNESGPAEQAPTAADGSESQSPHGAESDLIRKSSRLFVRNLPYGATEDDLRSHFERFGPIEELHLVVDKSGSSKGYALVSYEDSSSAISAFQTADGMTFQGRILHLLPASARKGPKLDDIAKLPLKKQNLIRKRAEAASSTFNWNSMYMSQDAVNASVADRLGLSKSDLLDPTSADAGVKQAIAETSVIQETKAYFAANGVDLGAFKSHKKGDAVLLVKNFSYGTTIADLRKLFEEYGPVLRVLMPPSGTIAIVQYAQAAHGKTAFAKLAYRRYMDSLLFLEKGPKDLFGEQSTTQSVEDRSTGIQKLSVAELLEHDDDQDQTETTSLFVRNLNFATTTEKLTATFRSLEGFVSAQVKTKPDPKRAGQVLSCGYGFVAFRSRENAQTALKVMDGFALEGHSLAVKASHKGLDAAEERRRADRAQKLAAQRTKLVIKNLPFEATKKDVRSLFGTYGQLRGVRLPKKFGNSSRGFAFAEFVTAREAEACYNALNQTHLLGRKLVLEFAETEAVDAEDVIEQMTKKIGGQVNKMSLQKLTGGGRKKVNIGDDEEEA